VFYCAKASRKERDAGMDDMPLKTGGGMQGTADQTLLTGSGNIRNNKVRNPHPTVKPLKLTQYLATLLLPPPSYNTRLFIPFSGVGSEMIGALLAGWEFVQGVELSQEYADIAEQRIKHYTKKEEQPRLL